MNRQKSVVEFYVLCNRLKNVIRTGWKNWNVKRERIESVAEHIFGVQVLAIAMYSQYQYDIDLSKVCLMLAVHELEEILIGDLTEWDISKEDKLERGHEAVSKILSNLLSKEKIEELIWEFDTMETKEALFSYHCDKLECDLQCKLYDEEGCVDMFSEENSFLYQRSESLKISEEDKTWSDRWLSHDRDKFLDDDNFLEVLDYVKGHSINCFDKE